MLKILDFYGYLFNEVTTEEKYKRSKELTQMDIWKNIFLPNPSRNPCFCKSNVSCSNTDIVLISAD